MADITFEITKHLHVLSTGAKGWRRECNFVSWNKAEPKFDIRDWSEDHTKMGKGIVLSKNEIEQETKAQNCQKVV